MRSSIPAGPARSVRNAYQLLEILHFGEVEIHQCAGRRSRPAGTELRRPDRGWCSLAQPYGAFAKTMLERQVYPDLRYYPGGPPIPPYDVTAPHARPADGGRRPPDRRADSHGGPGAPGCEIAPPRTPLPAAAGLGVHHLARHPMPDSCAAARAAGGGRAALPHGSRPVRVAAAAAEHRAGHLDRAAHGATPSGSWNGVAERDRARRLRRRPEALRRSKGFRLRECRRASVSGGPRTTCRAAGCCGCSSSTSSTMP